MHKGPYLYFYIGTLIAAIGAVVLVFLPLDLASSPSVLGLMVQTMTATKIEQRMPLTIFLFIFALLAVLCAIAGFILDVFFEKKAPVAARLLMMLTIILLAAVGIMSFSYMGRISTYLGVSVTTMMTIEGAVAFAGAALGVVGYYFDIHSGNGHVVA
jgi:uncharacterized membrane protein YwzB